MQKIASDPAPDHAPDHRATAGDGPERGSTPATPDTQALIAEPYAAYRHLRDAGPVHRFTGTDGLPAWLVTRYEDVRRALADPRLSLDKRNAKPGNYRGLALPPALDANLLNMDPPDHTRLRRLVSAAFTPRRVERLRQPVREAAYALLDAVADRGHADLIACYAGPLPITVICDLLGVPGESRYDFRAWTDAIVTPDPDRPHLAAQAVATLVAFLTDLIERKRADPGDDLISDLVAVQDGDDRLSGDELTSLAFSVLFGGYENTVHLIGNAVLALLDHPDQLGELRAHPERIPGAVEEFARYDGPIPLAIRRFTLEDVEIGGTVIPAGETVLLGLASAHRDPARFPGADHLDTGRGDTGHLGFGHGIHYCVGAPLARLETVIAIEALLDRFPRLDLAVARDTLRWRPTLRARGLIMLPVRWS